MSGRPFLAAMTAFLCVAAQAQRPVGDFVVGFRSAYLPAPAEIAVAPSVTWFQWSPDGQALIALRADETNGWVAAVAAISAGRQPEDSNGSKLSITPWSRRSHAAGASFALDAQKATISQVEWIDGSAIALVNVSEEIVSPDGKPAVRQTLIRVPLSGEPAQVLAKEDNAPSMRIAIWVAQAPGKGPAFVLQRSSSRIGSDSPTTIESTVTPILADGRLGKSIKMPVGYVASEMFYDSQGQPWVRLRTSIDAPSTPEARGAWGLLDVRAGVLRIQDNNQVLLKAPERETPGDTVLSLVTTSSKLSQSTSSASVTPLWLATDREGLRRYALLSADAKLGALTPTKDAVAYVSQGALTVREIVKAPLTLVQASLDEAERLHTVSQAKQCGLALMMLAAEFDDQFPAAEDFTAAMLEPYMRNPADLKGFTYTFRGGRIVDIAAPENTEIGYVKGQDGRAVVYADGHVKWVGEAP